MDHGNMPVAIYPISTQNRVLFIKHKDYPFFDLFKIGGWKYKLIPVVSGLIPKGKGRIAGIVTWTGIPDSRPVRVYSRATGILLQSGQSNANGVYQIEGLPMGEPLTILSIDTTGVYNAVVADNVLAVL
jgi:hypothetical protein